MLSFSLLCFFSSGVGEGATEERSGVDNGLDLVRITLMFLFLWRVGGGAT